MANPLPSEPGAPVAKDALDPELIRLTRPRLKVSLITAAGLVFLCGYFLVRLTPDRHFAASSQAPQKTAVADVIGNRVPVDRFISLDAQPLLSHAIRTATSPSSLGLRAAPIRGTDERLWVAMSGDGWQRPMLGAYAGRLRRLADLPFAASIAAYAREHSRPSFAAADAVRAGFATGTVRGLSGDPIAVVDGDRVAFDVADSSAAVIVGVTSERLPSDAAWGSALATAGIATIGSPQRSGDAVRFTVKNDNGTASLEAKLNAAKLWAARIEPVVRHYNATWGELKRSPPAGFSVGSAVIPNGQVELIGLYVARAIPSDAYVLIAGEHPDDYWYVQPITIALALMGVLFAVALIRAVRRDLLPTQASLSTTSP